MSKLELKLYTESRNRAVSNQNYKRNVLKLVYDTIVSEQYFVKLEFEVIPQVFSKSNFYL